MRIKTLILAILLIVILINGCFYENKYQDNITKEQIIMDLKQEKDIKKIVDFCFLEPTRLRVLTNCPREMFCAGPRCLNEILILFKGEEKIPSLCFEIENKMNQIAEQQKIIMDENWKAENCIKTYGEKQK